MYRTDFTDIKLELEKRFVDYFWYLGQKFWGSEQYSGCWNGDKLEKYFGYCQQ